MSAAPAHAEPLADAQAARLLKQVALSQAAHLAREGNYAAAEELLSGIASTECPDASILDLLARIRAQQGAFFDAEAHWRKVLQIDPAHLGARAGLERLRQWQRAPIRLWPILATTTGLGIVLAGGIFLSWQVRSTADLNRQIQALAEGISTLQTVQTQTGESLVKWDEWGAKIDRMAATQGTLSERFTDMQTENGRQAARQETSAAAVGKQLETLALAVERQRTLVERIERRSVAAANDTKLPAQAAPSTNPPRLAISIPGVTTSASGKQISVTFDDGLFDRGTHFKPGAKERLTAVAKALGQSKTPLQIQVVGYADKERTFFRRTEQSESALALERASMVVGQLLELEAFRPENLSAVSGNSKKHPNSNATAQDRAKNRTVILNVTSGTSP